MVAAQDYNPIKSVIAVNIDGSAIGGAVLYTNLMIPSEYEYTLTDNSAPDAGRTEDQAMHKMRIGQTLRLDVKWSLPTLAECALLLTAFNAEYINVNYLDAKLGTWTTKRFYVGDRKTPLWNSTDGRWESLGFGLIQQNADLV